MGTGLGQYLLLAFYLSVMVAALVSILRQPHIGLYVLIVLLPNQTLRYKLQLFPLGAQTVDILLLAIAIGILARGDTLFAKTHIRTAVFLLWFSTYVSLWLGSLMQDLPLPLLPGDERFSFWKNYCRIPFIAFLALGALRDRRQILIAVAMMTIGLAWVERGFILSNRGRSFSTFSYGLRDAGTMPLAGENGLAAFLAQTGIFLAGFAAGQPFLRRWFFTAVMIVSMICMVLTFSRGSYLAFALAFLALGVFRRRGLLATSLLVVVAALMLGFTLVPGAVVERVTMTTGEDGQLENSAASRLEMWEIAIEMFSSNPLLGAGFETFKYLSRGRVAGLADTHNYYMRALAETGLTGLFIHLFLLWSAWRSSWALFRHPKADGFLSSLGLGSAVCLICLTVVNLFGDRWTYLEISGYTFLIFGMVARGHQLLTAGNVASEQRSEAEKTGGETPEPAALPVAPLALPYAPSVRARPAQRVGAGWRASETGKP